MAKIRREIIYSHPIELVWQAISTKEALSKWLMEADFEPTVGYQFTFKTDPGPGFDGIVTGEVLTVDPPHTLIYSWRGGPLLSTTVSYQLSEVPNGTKLQFEHTGFTGIKQVMPRLILTAGWRKLLTKEIYSWLENRAKAK